MSTWIIGDVHGHFEVLERLIAAISYDPTRDRLVFLGDLVCGGGGSADVIRFAMAHQADVTLGNHDLHMLAVAAGARDARRKDDFEDVLNAADRDAMLNWLRRRPLALHLPEFGALIVHAGVLPAWSVSQTLDIAEEVSDCVRQGDEVFATMYGNRPVRWKDARTGPKRIRCAINALTRMRIVDKKGRMQFDYSGLYGWVPRGWMPWFEHPRRATRDTLLVFGHWAALGTQRWIKHNAVSLDGGVRWGRELCALRLDDRAIVSVPAAR